MYTHDYLLEKQAQMRIKELHREAGNIQIRSSYIKEGFHLWSRLTPFFKGVQGQSIPNVQTKECSTCA